jgi:hypothetical protein
MFRDNVSVTTLEDGTETSANNYHTTPRNIPEEHRSHKHRDGSLKSMEGIWKEAVEGIENGYFTD